MSKVAEALSHDRYRFMHRTDIRGYYAHIRKEQVMAQVNRYVTDPVYRDLIEQYVFYSIERGGEISTPLRGIPRGCALSPLIGGSLLHHVDSHYQTYNRDEIFYVRYMDDFLLLTRTRWQLRRGIGTLASYFDYGGFERHPDKTQTGRVEKGFDWLGIWFGPEGTTLSPRALNNHRDRRLRLYERARTQGASHQEALVRVQVYEARWTTWAQGLIGATAQKKTLKEQRRK
ncbi:reverse transcriptase domain-containing protein [Serratia fonticola]|uniref:reverse transcriptase domain-containing protein n=1 Tax=Serratia fonticola TaxID=47917 RepID=UPI0021B78AA8|nr:reverse transcriptase domain-containing protein [Serratia fonticola]